MKRPFLADAGALAYDRVFIVLAVVIAALAAFTAIRVRKSKFGRSLIAVRDNELAAATSGIAVAHMKVAAFTAAALFGVIARSPYGWLETYATPDTVTFDISIMPL